MIRLRFFFKGSAKEKIFLDKKKSEGYILEAINYGLYKFKVIDNLTNTSLKIEFSDKTVSDILIEENSLVRFAITKKLQFTAKNIIYSYIDKRHDLEIITETDDIEIEYLEETKNKLYYSNLFITISLLLIWFVMLILEKPLSHLLYLMPLSWLIHFIIIRKFSKRIEELAGDADLIPSEIKIVIYSAEENLDIEPLNFLGNWRYVSSKKHYHYYSLYTNYSCDDLKNEISSCLNIKETDINIISNLGLYPIGYI